MWTLLRCVIEFLKGLVGPSFWGWLSSVPRCPSTAAAACPESHTCWWLCSMPPPGGSPEYGKAQRQCCYFIQAGEKAGDLGSLLWFLPLSFGSLRQWCKWIDSCDIKPAAPLGREEWKSFQRGTASPLLKRPSRGRFPLRFTVLWWVESILPALSPKADAGLRPCSSLPPGPPLDAQLTFWGSESFHSMQKDIQPWITG